MPDIIYSVFVSSTFDDLREERGELQKALLKSKCFPIGMELFPSSDVETWDFIKRQIDQTDYYIVYHCRPIWVARAYRYQLYRNGI